MARLVVASNRVAPVAGRSAAGGLATGILQALRETGGLWFGWSGKVAEAGRLKPRLVSDDGLAFATIELSRRAYERYYLGFANRTLWPLFHYRIDLTAFDHEDYRVYRKTNAALARALSTLLRADDLVWVHDYHLIPLGEELRTGAAAVPLGFFLHIPFPPPDLLAALPWAGALLRAFAAYDVVGFQTARDRDNFVDAMVRLAGGRREGRGRLAAFGRQLRIDTFPVGIDVARLARLAASPDARRQVEALKARYLGEWMITGVDRLDYTKGLVERLRAIEAFLAAHPERHGRLSFVQVAAPSREDVPEYRRIRRELETVSGHINARFSGLDWQPIHLVNRTYSQRTLAGLYRACRVGLVTPLRDGMNLVAKEYVAAQDEENPGALVLSRFAGAAEELDGAIIVNPHDVEDVVAGLEGALAMAPAERRARWRRMMKKLEKADAAHWRRRFLSALSAASAGSDVPAASRS